MGQLASKKPKLEINEVDRAVLTLKSQVRKLEQQRNRIQGNCDREMAVARQLVAQGSKGRALLALKRRALQEQQLAKLEAWLLNVEEMLLSIEGAKSQQRLFAALKEGSSALKDLQKALPLEEVEQLMQDGVEAKAYEDSLRRMLGESLSPEEEQRAQGELEVLEAQLLDAQRLEMPRVPSGAAATVAVAARVPAAEAQVATEPAAEAASAGEPERVLVAA